MFKGFEPSEEFGFEGFVREGLSLSPIDALPDGALLGKG